MADAHLRPITQANLRACLDLQVTPEQESLVASSVRSLAEAYVDANLTPLAIYDAAACGYPEPDAPMVGFVMLEVVAGVGFIMRLMIGAAYQRQGYGRAAMVEAIRRLKLMPDVEIIATSYQKENAAAAALYAGLGFQPWQIDYALDHPTEVYVKLEE